MLIKCKVLFCKNMLNSKQRHWSLLLVVLLTSQYLCECSHSDTRVFNRPGKNLCARENYYKDVDCSNQVSRNSSAHCLMRYINRTSKDCGEVEFSGEVDTSEQYGGVRLQPFAWYDNSILFPSLNVTFTSIRWQALKMRFIKIGSSTPQICREFEVTENIDPASVISFDCLWGNGGTSEEHYRFQYTIITREGHKFLYTYLLQMPKDTDVLEDTTADEYRLFVVLDKTAFPVIRARLHVPPSRLNISKANIALFYQEDQDGPVETLKLWVIDFANKMEGDFIKLEEYDTGNTPGYYYYNASFTSEKCRVTCTDSSTPQLYIAGLRHGIQVTIAVIIISIAALALLVFILWNKKYKKLLYECAYKATCTDIPLYRRIKTVHKEGEKSPNVLFVYESSFPSHIENIYKFKQFLEDNCYVSAKLDLIDIPKSDSMNPWRWYYTAFEEADYVLVFASPSPESAQAGLHEDNVYQGLHAYATRLLASHLLHRRTHLHTHAAKIRLPGCDWATIPPEARTIDKEFALPERLGHLLKWLGVPAITGGGSRLLSALQQPRSIPTITIAPPSAPLSLPFDEGSVELEDLAREPLTVRGVTLNLDGHSSSDSDTSEGEEDPSLAGFKL